MLHATESRPGQNRVRLSGYQVLQQFHGGVQHQDVNRRPSGDGGGQMLAGVDLGEILAERCGLPSHGLDFPDDGGGIAEFLGRAGVNEWPGARPRRQYRSDELQPLQYASDDGYAAVQTTGSAGHPGNVGSRCFRISTNQQGDLAC